MQRRDRAGHHQHIVTPPKLRCPHPMVSCKHETQDGTPKGSTGQQPRQVQENARTTIPRRTKTTVKQCFQVPSQPGSLSFCNDFNCSTKPACFHFGRLLFQSRKHSKINNVFQTKEEMSFELPWDSPDLAYTAPTSVWWHPNNAAVDFQKYQESS